MFESKYFVAEFGIYLIVFAFTIAIFAEIYWDYKNHIPRKYADTRLSLQVSFGHVLIIHFCALGVQLFFLELVSRYAITSLPITLETWIVGFILQDMSFYWYHRLEHRSNLFWAFHSVHHSARDFNFAVSQRLPWVTPFYSWIHMIPLCLLGFDPYQIIICSKIGVVFAGWLHTKKVGKLNKWFEFFVNTPSHHRVHHGSNSEYLDKNYAAAFILWDRLFGTFQAEVDPVQYGLTKNIRLHGVWQANFGEFIRVGKKSLSSSFSLKQRLRYLLGPP